MEEEVIEEVTPEESTEDSGTQQPVNVTVSFPDTMNVVLSSDQMAELTAAVEQVAADNAAALHLEIYPAYLLLIVLVVLELRKVMLGIIAKIRGRRV